MSRLGQKCKDSTSARVKFERLSGGHISVTVTFPESKWGGSNMIVGEARKVLRLLEQAGYEQVPFGGNGLSFAHSGSFTHFAVAK